MKMNLCSWLLALVCSLSTMALAHGQEAKPLKEPAPKTWITKETQEAIDAGLAFLAKQQKADGSWGTRQYEGSVGITGLSFVT
jgi:squalene cyclase